MLVRVLIAFFWSLSFFGQTYETIGNPIGEALVPIHTFGAIQNYRVHLGVDFSTNKEVRPIFATDGGEVSRIVVSPFGLGTAVHIKHPSGYTTIYGHLDRLEEPLASYLKQKQYEKTSYEVELFPLLGELPIVKGQTVGFSGQTGNSYVPQLYFEVVETTSEDRINPLFFGLDTYEDSKPPIINQLWVYPKVDSVKVNHLARPLPIAFKRLSPQQSIADVVEINGAVGFVIDTYDRIDAYFGKQPPYKMEVLVNDSLYSQWTFDRCSIKQSYRFFHMIDYAKWLQSKTVLYKLFNTNVQEVPFFRSTSGDGYISIQPNQSLKVTLRVEDFKGNAQEIIIPLVHKNFEKKAVQKERKGKYIDYYRDYIFEDHQKTVEWYANTFYEDHYLEIECSEERVSILPTAIAIQKPLSIRFDVSNQSIDTARTFIARIDGQKVYYNKTWKRGTDFRIRSYQLGTFELRTDTIAPQIAIKSKERLRIEDAIVLDATDDLSGIGSYRGTINGQWALFAYDYKNHTLSHQLSDGIAQRGLNKLLIEIEDNLGNSTIFEWIFELK